MCLGKLMTTERAEAYAPALTMLGAMQIELLNRHIRRSRTQRAVDTQLDRDTFDTPTVLLCSEPDPAHCHRRLLAEYLRDRWGGLRIAHL